MLSAVELMLALRYLRARQSTRFASFISIASLFGIALGVTALITILSVMNGFERELRDRLLDLQAELTLTADASAGMPDWRERREEALERASVLAVTPYVGVEAMARAGGRLVPILVEGIDPQLEEAAAGIADSLRQGTLSSLRAGRRQIVLGRFLALDLGVGVGDAIVLLVPRLQDGTVRPRLVQFAVAGIFDGGVPEYDAGVGWVHWEDAAALTQHTGAPAGLRIRLADPFEAPALSAAFASAMDGVSSSDWTRENASYFRAIRLEKAMMALIVALVIGVAAFNIVASLVMVVTDKQTDIAILRTLGLAPQGVVRVFFAQGLILGWCGVLLGVVCGVLLANHVTEVVATLEQALGFQVMPADVYVMTEIPSEVRVRHVAWIGVLALALTALATLYPARRAAAVHPAQALRYGG